ncbi:hypothetical protein SAMN05444161_4461 [Rhizobiales bacterium GAS191]|nr:hypothetical protein SAMN05444161_4461 [Rhizobiales bacterium GAS191]
MEGVVPQSTGVNGGLAPQEPRRAVGIVPNAAHQAPRGLFDEGAYELAVVEFDDQGRCYERAQMDAVANRLDALAGADAIIVVFVHGWKHDARSDDTNLISFQDVLRQTVAQEVKAAAAGGWRPRPVLGVFVGWRGMSFYDRLGILDNVTFWDRQEAGRRVSVGSVRELFGRLRHYRNRRKDAGGAPLLVIVGHSFGGMIVYSALAQSLIEAATVPVDEVTPRFADLVLLVNPAVEAERYLPIYDLVNVRMQQQKGTDQPPVFVCATAKNDWATGLAFPIGNAFSLISESYRGREERQAMVNTIGHLPWMKTHDLVGSNVTPGYERIPVSPQANWSPFWVISTTPDIIDGHNGIFKDKFLSFVAGLVFEHVAYSMSKRPLRTMAQPR